MGERGWRGGWRGCRYKNGWGGMLMRKEMGRLFERGVWGFDFGGRVDLFVVDMLCCVVALLDIHIHIHPRSDTRH